MSDPLNLKPGRYQFMPDLAPDTFAALKADIASRGVVTPIDIDEDGNILDGHNRYRAWLELKKNEPPPTIIRAGLSEAEKGAFARRQNILRRHLSREEMRALIEAQLRDTPNLSDRAIAKDLGVDHKTVGATRRRASGEIPHARKTTTGGFDFADAVLGNAKVTRDNAARVAALPTELKLAMFEAGMSGAQTVVMSGNPFGHAPLTADEETAWNRFVDFFVGVHGWPLEAAGEHVSWLVDHHGYRTPGEWLGVEGKSYRARNGMREPSCEFLEKWKKFSTAPGSEQ